MVRATGVAVGATEERGAGTGLEGAGGEAAGGWVDGERCSVGGGGRTGVEETIVKMGPEELHWNEHRHTVGGRQTLHPQSEDCS